MFGWLSLGSCFLNRRYNAQLSLPMATLIGSGITGFLYSVMLRVSSVKPALTVAILATVAGILLAGGRAWQMVRHLAQSYKELWAGRKLIPAACAASFIFYSALASSPPRDADVMRYHLAHIRQIDREGTWQSIPDIHYALPFGWTLNYLPFEHWGIAEAAHFVNLAVWLLVVGVMYHEMRRVGNATVSLLLCGLFVYQPQILKAGTTAFADMYTILILLAVAIAVNHKSALPVSGYGLLGFAAWIGLQSRYQAAAIGLAVTLWMAVAILRKQVTGRSLAWYSAGAGCALLLASPFYISNWLAFGNPVWPLMTRGGTSYADHLAAKSMGPHTIPALLTGLSTLLTEPAVFPIPALAIGLLAACLWRRTESVREAGFLTASVLAVWAAAQPILQARFILMLVPLLATGWAPVLASIARGVTRRRIVVAGLAVCILGLVNVDVIYAIDGLRYLITGDLKTFHRATWFYDVYEWANRSMPKDAKFLVIVYSAQTYYLDRFYRRADPPLSAVVDWETMREAKQLDEFLERGGYRYVIYDDTDWSIFPGGAQMTTVIKHAIEQGLLTKARVFPLRLVTLRLRNEGYPTTVRVLERNGSRR